MQTFVNRAAGCWPKGGTRAVRGAAWRPGRTTVIVLLLAVLLLAGGAVAFAVLRYGYFGPTVPLRTDWPEVRRAHVVKIAARLGGREEPGAPNGWHALLDLLAADAAAYGAAGVDMSKARLNFSGPSAHPPEQRAAYLRGLRESGGMAALDRLIAAGPGVQLLDRFRATPFVLPSVPRLPDISSGIRSVTRALAYDIRRDQTPGSEVVLHARRLAALASTTLQDGMTVEFLLSFAIVDAMTRAVVDRACGPARLQPSELVELRSLLAGLVQPTLAEAIEAERLAARHFIDDTLADTRLRSTSRSAHATAVDTQFQFLLQAIERPVAELPGLLQRPTSGLFERGSFAEILLPPVGSLLKSSTQVTSGRRAAVLALAIVEFQTRHNRLPQALTELVPEFLPAIPLDAINEGQFVYSLAAAPPGFTIVSLGADGKPNPKPGEGDDRVLVPPRKD